MRLRRFVPGRTKRFYAIEHPAQNPGQKFVQFAYLTFPYTYGILIMSRGQGQYRGWKQAIKLAVTMYRGQYRSCSKKSREFFYFPLDKLHKV